MAIDFLPPLSSLKERTGQKRAVKRCIGTACYAALVAHFGTDSPKHLERRIDRPHGGFKRDANEDDGITNKYRRWRQGKAAPHDDTVAHVATRSAGSVRLAFWRDLPLWPLLAPDPPPVFWMHRLLESSSRCVSRILFGDKDPDDSFQHVRLERDQTLAIRNQYSLEAFIALLCIARKGEVLEDDAHHYLPAACAFDIFPRVLYRHPQLRYRWEELFKCIDRIFWQRAYSNGMSFDFPIETVRSNLDALNIDPDAKLPRKSGTRLRVIDTDPLKAIEDRVARAISVT